MRDDEPIGVEDRALDDAALEALTEAYARKPTTGLETRVREAAVLETRERRTRRALGRWRIVGTVAAGLAIAFGALLCPAPRASPTSAASS